MNPEENNNQVPDVDSLNQAIAPTPTPTPAPEVAPAPTPAANATPSLDQVAADLTSAAATNTPLDQTPAPAESAAPAEPITPAVEPATPAIKPAAPAEPNPAEQTPAMPAPETMPSSEPIAQSIPESSPFTEPVQPMPTVDTTSATSEASTSPTMPAAPTMPEASLQTPNMTTPDIPPAETPATDIPAATTPTGAEEPPLVPADPVPGSIGSAISYTDSTTQPLPAEKPKKSLGSSLKLSKDNIRLIAIIGGGIVLVAIVVIVIIAIASNTGTKKSSNNNNNTPTQPTTPTVSSLTCTKEGGRDVFSNYGEVVSGKEDIVVMYSDGYLSSFGTNLSLGYENEDAARAGETAARNEYQQMLSASKLTSDPFDSSYNVIDNSLTVTHQADGDTIDENNARALGLYVVKGEVIDDPETLIDNYETDGYTCVEK